MAATPDKAALEKASGAYRTIGELARETGLPQHILRYWETRFPQLRPLQRAGRRRYYRPEDVALVRRIAAMLGQDGYTIRGVQKQLLAESKRAGAVVAPPQDVAPPQYAASPQDVAPAQTGEAIRAIRNALADALVKDDRAAGF